MDTLDGRIVQAPSEIVRWLEQHRPEAASILTRALREGLAEFDQADRNDVWNVHVYFWPHTGLFSCSARDGSGSVGQGGVYPSFLLQPGDVSGILREVHLGHASVVVLSLTPYIRAGHELSVHALMDAVLTETQRVVNLGLPVSDTTAALLSI